MKKFLTLVSCILLIACISMSLTAQTITIPAANTNTNGARQPFGAWFGFERTELLYTQAEIGQYGTITSISFYVNSVSTPAASTPVQIRMLSTSSTVVSSGTYDTRSAGSTLVYSGNILSGQLTANSWVTITLDAPFVYSADNLAVFVETNFTGGGGEGSSGKQFRRSAPSPAATRFQSWSADTNPPTGSGTTSGTRSNIQLDFLQSPCTGIPSPGNTTGPSVVCSGVNFNLGLTNTTSGSGVSYQWYVSTVSNAGPWTPLGTSVSSLSTSQTQQSWYYCNVTCSTGPNSGASNVIQVNMDVFTNCYCNTINFTSAREPICLVQFAGINNSTCSALNCSPALEDFTAGTPASVAQGQMYPITVSGNTDGNFTNHFRAFFDWDQNGSYESSVVIGTIANTNCVGQATANITIPLTATLGSTRMRIVKLFNASPTDPCASYGFGQAEDYSVNVGPPPPPCPTPGSLSASPTHNSATVSWAPVSGATLYRYSYGSGAHVCGTGSVTTAGALVNLTGLLPSTTYTFCVSTDACTGGIAGNYASFTFTTAPPCGIPLSFPWTLNSIGASNGSGSDNLQCSASIDITSTNIGSTTTDVLTFGSQQFCGNFTICAKLLSVTNQGWGGLMVRENTATGSKKVALRSQLTNIFVRDLRTTTNGPEAQQQYMKPGHVYMRLTRTGNTFIGSTSPNGISWQQVFAVSLVLPNCVDAGLFAQSINAAKTTTASFGSLCGFASSQIPNITDQNTTNRSIDTEKEFSVYPNPASDEINVKWISGYTGKAANITVTNQLGQTVATQKLGAVTNEIETINVSQLTNGMYILSVQSEDKQTIHRKFTISSIRP
ncbi:MAG: T9SS type A sorting domain-containing protein [Saprospiraceae bacterium]|nr:T9SS type A sorting domain-containing protein [Saprospiraceae bacterium]MBP6567443.1 T9SS type A sorting domain-containing protein [Saprospiraceae bacterium]